MNRSKTIYHRNYEDYTDDLVLPANIPAEAELQLHTLEQAGRGIDLYVNVDKTDFMNEASPHKVTSL